MQIGNLYPRRSDRALFVGQTGSGKTTLAKFILQSRAYVVVLDTKGMIFWRGYDRQTTFKGLCESEAPRLIYAPTFDELQSEETIENFFEFVYLRQHCTLYVDEAFSISDSSRIPKFYHAILTRGRERNIECWSGSQRPSGLPQVILSESEHYYIFRLQLEPDSKKVRTITAINDEAIRQLPKRKFFYFNHDEISGPYSLKIQTGKGRKNASEAAITALSL